MEGGDWVCIALTHSCSITREIELEPKLELIVARPATRNNANVGRKHPRLLHIDLTVDGQPVNHEIRIVDRAFIDKRKINGIARSPRYEISAKDTLIRWIVARYNAPAFPNEFNRRRAGITNRLAAALGNPAAEHIISLFVQLSPEEEDLPEGQPYEVNAILLIEAGLQPAQIDALEAVRSRVETIIRAAQPDGIHLQGNLVMVSEDNISLTAYRQYDLLQFDYLSERETPGGPTPIAS